MMEEKKKKSEKRKKGKIIPVRVSPQEQEIIESKAAQCSLAPSTYLRELGLEKKLKSNLDQQAVRELFKLRADIGRVGGLFKAWLSPKQKDIGTGSEAKAYLENNKPDVKDLLRAIDFNISQVEGILKRL